MTTINIKVVDQTLQLMNNPTIASGGVETSKMAFEFDSSWEEFARTAVFYRSEKEVYNVVLDNIDLQIMHIVKTNQTFTRNLVDEVCEISPKSSQIRLKKLIEQNLLGVEGVGKATRYYKK